MENSPIKVNSIGFDERSLNMLTLALKEKSNGACVITSEAVADLVLLNLDSSDIHNLHKDFKLKNPKIPEIGVCKKNIDSWEITQLNIPLVVSDLVTTITNELARKTGNMVSKITDDKIAAAMQAIDAKKAAGGLQKRRDLTSGKNSENRAIPKKTDEMCFNTERFLLGYVLDAVTKSKKENKSAVLKCWSDKTILIDCLSLEITTDVTDNQIRNMAIAPLDDDLSSPVKVVYLDSSNEEYINHANKNGMRKISLEVFMWNLGSMTCRGRIPIDASVSERQYLMRWPNITRIKLGENALRIISYWVNQPCSLYDIQQALDVPLQDVFMVYTAAFSAGLASNAKRNSDHIFEVPDVQDNIRRGLFSRIVTRLKNISHEAA